MNQTFQLTELRNSIAAGSYVVDAEQVAGTIARKLAEVDRVSRSLSARRNGRSHEPAAGSLGLREARRPRPG